MYLSQTKTIYVSIRLVYTFINLNFLRHVGEIRQYWIFAELALNMYQHSPPTLKLFLIAG